MSRKSRFFLLPAWLMTTAIAACSHPNRSSTPALRGAQIPTNAGAVKPDALEHTNAHAGAAMEGATFVSGTEGKPLFSAPGGLALALTRSNRSLLLEDNGAGWIRILDAEGNAGWIRDVDLKRNSAALRACRRPFRITNLLPAAHDQPDFTVTEVPPEANGRIIGASKANEAFSLPYVVQRGRATEFLSDGRTFTAPLAHVDFNGTTGWAGFDELCSPMTGESQSTIGAIQSLGVVGLLHPFFVESLSSTFSKTKPTKQSKLIPFNHSKPVLALKADWSAALAAAIVPANASGIGGVTLHELDAELYAMAVVSNEGHAAWISVDGTQTEPTPVMVRMEHQDLNNDGKSEVLIELDFLNGDGVAGQLMVLDGNLAPDVPLQHQVLSLGGSSGEPGGSSASWSWYAEPGSNGGTAVVWTLSSVPASARDKVPKITAARHILDKGQLKKKPTPQAHIVFACGESQSMREQKTGLELAGAGPLTLWKGGERSPSCIGKLFEKRSLADTWKAKHPEVRGLKVQRVPPVRD